MTAQQTLVAFLFILLIGLSVHEYWQPQISALLGNG
jgi:hypothetical protein